MINVIRAHPLIIIVILGFLVRLYNLTTPLADWHSFRQSDTASVARAYVKHGVDLLHPRYHDLSNIQSGFENPQGYRMVEFPLISGLVAVTYPPIKALTQWPLHVWYRFTSILFSLGSIIILYKLTHHVSNQKSALIAAAFFALMPYNVYYSRTILPEIPLVFLYLVSLLAGLYALRNPSLKWFALSAVSAAIALLLKPTAIFMLTPLLIVALFSMAKNPKKIILWLVAGAVIVLPLYYWRRWITQYPEGIPASGWLLNGNAIRLRPAWFRWLFYERLTKRIVGFAGVVPLLLGVYVINDKFKRLEKLFIFSWIIGAIAYLIIFATGNVQHDYYQIMLIPLISLVFGIGFHQFSTFKLPKLALPSYVILALSIGLSWIYIRGYYQINNWAIVHAGQAIDQKVPAQALVIAPYEGDTAFLYQTNRRGWPIGFHIDKKIESGAQYYISVNYDDEARQLESKYQTIEKTDEYLILDLTQPRPSL